MDRLQEAGGCARRAQLIQRRGDRDQLAALVSAGVVVRVGQGVYALPGTPSPAVTMRLANARLTCVSAAATWGLPLLEPARGTHLVVPRGRSAPPLGRLPPHTVLHWDARESPGIGIAPVPLALEHLVRCRPFGEAVAVVDAALNRGLVRRDDLLARRPLRDRVPFERVLLASDGRSQSLPETLVRLALRGAGLRLEPQAPIEGVGRVDLLVEGVLVVEVDGRAFHSDAAAFAEDRRRDRVLNLSGLPVMRFTYWDAVREPRRVAHEVSIMVDRLSPSRRPAVAARARQNSRPV